MSNLVKYGKYDASQAAKDREQADKTGGGTFLNMKKPGKYQLRFLPPPLGKASHLVIVPTHYVELPGAGNKPVSHACPLLLSGRPCPTCDLVDQLKGTGNQADNERAYKMQAKNRTYANVVHRREPGKVFTYAFGKTIFDDLEAIMKDPDAGGDYTDPMDGFDIIVERIGTGKEDTEYKVFPSRNNSKLAATEEELGEILSAAPKLDRYAKVLSVEEIRALLSGEGGGRRQERDVGGGRTRGARGRSAADEVDSTASKSDSEDIAF